MSLTVLIVVGAISIFPPAAKNAFVSAAILALSSAGFRLGGVSLRSATLYSADLFMGSPVCVFVFDVLGE